MLGNFYFDQFNYSFLILENISVFSIFFLAPEFLLIFGIVIFLCFIKNIDSFYVNTLFFYLVLFLELILCIVYLYCCSKNFIISQQFFYDCFIFDTYSIFCKFIFVFFLLIIGFFSEFKFTWNKISTSDLLIPVYFFLLFALFLLSAFDFFSAYLSLEGVSLTLYILTANTYSKRIAIEATIKYLLFGGISNGVFLFASSIVFGLCGSLNYTEVRYLTSTLSIGHNSIEICSALICFVIVFLFKIAAFPCHMWSPDVYDGVWLPISAILIVLVKFVYLCFFLRLFFYTFIKLMFLWQPLILLSSLGSLVIGSFGIIGQDRIKRLIAYSSINHVSFILLGIACGTLTGVSSALLYLIIYSLTLFIFFGFILNIRCLVTGRSLIYLSDFANLAKFSVLSSQIFLIMLFSMGGLPPLAGFFVKLYIYIEAVGVGFYLFVFFSLIITIVSTFYYLFFLKSIFFETRLLSLLISFDFTRKTSEYFVIFVYIMLLGFIFISDYVFIIVSNTVVSLYIC